MFYFGLKATAHEHRPGLKGHEADTFYTQLTQEPGTWYGLQSQSTTPKDWLAVLDPMRGCSTKSQIYGKTLRQRKSYQGYNLEWQRSEKVAAHNATLHQKLVWTVCLFL